MKHQSLEPPGSSDPLEPPQDRARGFRTHRGEIWAGFALALVILILVGGVALYTTTRLASSSSMVAHTYVVIEHLESLDGQIADLHNAARVYALTGDRDAMEGVRSRRLSIQSTLAELRKLVSDNPAEVARGEALRRSVERNLDLLDRIAAIERKQGPAAALTFARANDTSAAANQISHRIATMVAVERGLLDRRRASESGARGIATRVIIYGTLGAIVFVVFSGVFIYRALRTLRLATLYAERSARAARERGDQLALQAEEARQGRAQFVSLLESATESIMTVDSAGSITYANQRTTACFGYSVAELTGMEIEKLIPQADRDRHREHRAEFMQHLRVRSMAVNLDLHALRKDGVEFPVEVSLSPVTTRVGAQVLVTVRDISERVRTERELRRRTVELARSNAELEQFAYVASHDLQEPLRMVASYLQLIEQRYRGRLDADADDFINYAVDGARRMKQLINDLLNFSRAGRGPEPRPVELAAALERALAVLGLAIEESHAVIDAAALPHVMGDENRLAEVFQNLISNALKFRGSEPPRIHIGAERTDGFWTISVSDNGIGIAPDYRERIFVMFQRLHGRETYPGTGIGLAICKRIVERLGGRIWVESQPGRGATFRFTLPAEVEEVRAIA